MSQAAADGAHGLEMLQLFGQDAQHQDASLPGADLLKNIGADNSMQICVHELEHQGNIAVVVGLQYNNMCMGCKWHTSNSANRLSLLPNSNLQQHNMCLDKLLSSTPSYFWVFTGQIYTVSGTYQFLDVNNCVLEILNLSLTNDIAEESSNAFTIFPNPTNGNVVISLFSDDQCGLNVYDSQGQLVFENPSISNGEAVKLSDYSPGVYIFRVYTSNQIHTRRIIKN